MKNHRTCPSNRILIIDDNTSIHEDFCKILIKNQNSSNALEDLEAELFGSPEQTMQTSAFEIDCASQGKEGLAMVQKARAEGHPYALAFVDGRMPPGWDGIETITHLWRESPDLQVVLCTAYSDCSWQELRQLFGETDGLLILKKPFDNIEVLQMTHALTQKWELNREVQGRLNQLAFYDSLTGLPNRTLFLEQLTKTLAQAKRCKHNAALLFIDLDNFKRINDTLGHSVGDDLLKTTSQRLTKCLRTSDTSTRSVPGEMAARLGGDEFTVILPELKKKEDAAVVAKRIAEQLSHPMQLGDHQVIVTPSIGIALFPQDGDNMETLLQNADIAMYFSKRIGPNMFNYYRESMNSQALKRMTLENHLRQAFERDEFTLHYQPQFDLLTGQITGVEALLRWHNWELGEVPPIEFLPIAEETGIIINIGEWVMRTACTQARSWLDKGIPLRRIAINISTKQFVHPDFLKTVADILTKTHLEPQLLEFEISEKVIVKPTQEISALLNALKEMNVQITVDNFGTGYSSLGRLENTPIDSLKIDSTFISGINGGRIGQSIICAILAMAEGMDLRVVAGGVETKEQVDFLREKQCREGQGFLFSKTMSPQQIEVFLQKSINTE